MTAPLIHRPSCPQPTAQWPTGVLVPQLRSTDGAPSPAAAIALSRRHDAVLSLNGRIQTPADLGRAGLSIRAAWDQSATNLLLLARAQPGMRFWLRALPAAPGQRPWNELAVDGAAATSWLAHPRTFTVLNEYLTTRFAATPIYSFDEDTSWTIRVRGEDPSSWAGPSRGSELIYRAGFPVPLSGLRETVLSPQSAPLLLAA
ncbi:hypothetical protein [Corynebacterium doosanense]|uniref:Uncharacterized protein n=1 Tax=Corynebacterium doosanense CAU 212 = DSM 45436 TaxID=558173 RepID=A0A097IGY7_9CORY|nr:hypothetical protein [Corynebacterium doosanense]AIT61428.1 hypothetical protein CDOO_09245 [Corynebacterium doosanense CAU 212 = DSM 45436]